MSLAPPTLPQNKALSVPPIAVPTHGPGGVFSIACSTTISGSALSCLEKVLDFSGYGSWNTFIPSAEIISSPPTPPTPTNTTTDGNEENGIPSSLLSRVTPGTRILFHPVMRVGGTERNVPGGTELEVTFLETFTPSPIPTTLPSSTAIQEEGVKGYRVAWKAMGMPGFLLRSERVQEFIERRVEGEGRVETEYKCWETFGGILAHVLPRAALEDGFKRWMDGLKGVVEGSGKEEEEVIVGGVEGTSV